MANTVSGKSEVLLALTGLNPSDVRRTRDELFPDLVDTWADGTTGANMLHAQYAAELTITQALGNVELDLQTVLDAMGIALALTELRVLLVYVYDNAEHRALEISGGASNAVVSLFASVAGGKLPVGPGGKAYASEPIAGFAIDGTHKTLKFTRVGGGGTDVADLIVDVYIAGLRP